MPGHAGKREEEPTQILYIRMDEGRSMLGADRREGFSCEETTDGTGCVRVFLSIVNVILVW